MDYEPNFLAPLIFAIASVVLVMGIRRSLVPRVRLRGILLIIAAVLLVTLTRVQAGIAKPTATSETDSPLRRHTTSLAEKFIRDNALVNLAVVVVADGKTEIICSGSRNIVSNVPVTENTLFEIGSVTKTFTGLLLAKQIAQRKLNLDDPVASLLPDSLALPGATRESISLRHLASHTSGLRGVPVESSNAEEFFAELANTSLASEPGAEMVYSNMGASLLGYALSHEKASYEAMLNAEILKPLNMRGTTISVEHKSMLPEGYGSSYRIGPFIFGRRARVNKYAGEHFAGMGAIRSTPADMLKYLQAQMGVTHSTLDSAIRLSHSELFRSKQSGKIGMFWFLPTDSGVIWHNGQTPGFRTFMGFTSDGRFGVVLMTATRRPVEALGLELLREMRQQ